MENKNKNKNTKSFVEAVDKANYKDLYEFSAELYPRLRITLAFNRALCDVVQSGYWDTEQLVEIYDSASGFMFWLRANDKV